MKRQTHEHQGTS